MESKLVCVCDENTFFILLGCTLLTLDRLLIKISDISLDKNCSFFVKLSLND
jgi:hypothetical protein